MNAPAAICALPDLGVLRVRGPDARRFLQGQLSNDLAGLNPGTLVHAGLHNPQGRTLALLALLAWSEEDLGAILPLELLAEVIALLRRYVLRARVTLSDEHAALRVYGLRIDEGAPRPQGALGFTAGRALHVLPEGASAPDGIELARDQWRALDIAAGMPQVYRATSGQFVAQMLNLDCIDAISFSKGCYTGQEVIARAHYRGRVKRRMQRFASSDPLELAPGDALQLEDGRALRVVEAVARADGGTEFLAVAPLPGAGAMEVEAAEPAATAPGAATAPVGAAAPVATAARVRAWALPLPYALPP
jgi:folate-binding protein YgfZ